MQILKTGSISHCKVVDIEEDSAKKLVAHLVLRTDTDKPEEINASIWDDLRKTLPSYMGPDYYKIRSSMPVHNNGKRDVAALRNDKDGLIKTNYGIFLLLLFPL